MWLGVNVYTFILHSHSLIIIRELETRSIEILKTSLIKSFLIFLETMPTPTPNGMIDIVILGRRSYHELFTLNCKDRLFLFWSPIFQ